MALSASFGVSVAGLQRRVLRIVISLGTLWTAYLWLLDATGSDSVVPTLPDELRIMLVVYSIVLGSSLITLLISELFERLNPRKK